MDNEFDLKTGELSPKTKENNSEVSITPKNLGDQVSNIMSKYIERGLTLPADYNVENAVISSFLTIQQDPKLFGCTKTSIVSALIDMATMGLNVSKKQAYFVPYGGELKLSPSYFGAITSIKRINGVVDIVADIIYEGTEYELGVNELGGDTITITKPCPLDKRQGDKIVAAWGKVILDESVFGRKEHTCIMTMEQIKASWNQGAMKGNSPAHKNFPDQMARKTVINRTCKDFVNSAKDNDILIETINRTMSNDYIEIGEGNTVVKEKKVIDFD